MTEQDNISVRADGPRWVSRAAGKLVGAFEAFGPLGLSAEGRRCLDIGASTGGFTQVLLQHGAAHVTALDVGHDQLAQPIADDPRVEERSGTTIRDATAQSLGGRFDLIVADLSFISLRLVLDTIASLLDVGGDAVVLVKPQFEVGRQRLGKNGIVRSASDRAWAMTGVAESARDAGLPPRCLAPSPVIGGEGNSEYLLWLSADPSVALPWEALVARADELSVNDTHGK